MAKFVWKRASKKSQPKNVKRTPIMRRNAYSPYPSIRGTNPSNAITFKGKGFPDRLTTNLVYTDTIILDPSAGTPCPNKTYTLNGCFDPDFSLGGTQPTYWDQLSLIYSRYKVKGSKMTAIFSRSTTVLGDVGPYICGIQCSDNSTIVSTNPQVLMSSPNTGFRVVNQEDGSVSVSATYSQRIRIQISIQVFRLVQMPCQVFNGLQRCLQLRKELMSSSYQRSDHHRV